MARDAGTGGEATRSRGAEPADDAARPGRSTLTWTGPRPIDDTDAERPSGRRFRHLTTSWMGWRLRLLVACALIGCTGLFALVRAVASAPVLDVAWIDDGTGRIKLARAGDLALAPFIGRTLQGAIGGDGAALLPDPGFAAPQPARWIVDDRERARRVESAARWRSAFEAGPLRLVFDGGAQVAVRPGPRTLAGLPIVFWPLVGFALALYLIAMTVVLAHPCTQNLAFVAMALPQSANLVLVAIDRTLPFGLTAESLQWTPTLQFVLDWTTAAAMVHAACLHPRRLPGAAAIGAAAWSAVALVTSLALARRLPHLWGWTQGSVTALGIATLVLYSWSHRLEPHPFSFALRRFGLAMLSTWVLLTAAVLAAAHVDTLADIAVTGPITWYLFLASLLLLVPALARSQHFLREFALLALTSTVATSLDLLFVVVFSFGQVTSLALALFASFAVYTGLRQWVLNRLVGENLVTTERMFEQLYRAAREAEMHPENTPALLSDLMIGLFDPLEVARVERSSSRVRIGGGGSSLHVPVPILGSMADGGPTGTLVLRNARRGRRLFAEDDARLASRVVEQLRRAVLFDRAVEQGRSEERLRLAQDLHDDIGARLLTLMYQAPTPEMEDYVRHTLQDLKTLTRGLATADHRVAHAAAEWKADIGQRATAAGLLLNWAVGFHDEDQPLSVVQWSALTRILRELVTNAIAHARATRIEIDLRFDREAVALRVADDGQGGDPRTWSHGLGLGGVRKRVKQLGGTVEWRRAGARGIECRVRIASLGTTRV